MANKIAATTATRAAAEDAVDATATAEDTTCDRATPPTTVGHTVDADTQVRTASQNYKDIRTQQLSRTKWEETPTVVRRHDNLGQKR